MHDWDTDSVSEAREVLRRLTNNAPLMVHDRADTDQSLSSLRDIFIEVLDGHMDWSSAAVLFQMIAVHQITLSSELDLQGLLEASSYAATQGYFYALLSESFFVKSETEDLAGFLHD